MRILVNLAYTSDAYLISNSLGHRPRDVGSNANDYTIKLPLIVAEERGKCKFVWPSSRASIQFLRSPLLCGCENDLIHDERHLKIRRNFLYTCTFCIFGPKHEGWSLNFCFFQKKY